MPIAGAVLLFAFAAFAQASREETARQIEALLRAGDRAAAAKAVEAAIAASPRDPLFRNIAGITAVQAGDRVEAEAAFRKAIELEPRFRPPYFNLGRLYQESGQWDKAAETYAALLRVSPTDAEAHYQAATVAMRQDRYVDVLRHVESLPADARSRGNVVALECSSVVFLGRDTRRCASAVAGVALEESDAVQLIGALEKKPDAALARALVAKMSDKRLLRRLAGVLELSGELAAARELLERTADRPPALEQLVDVARVAYKQRQWEDALGYLAHARDLDPKMAPVHFFFGMTAVELDLIVEAERAFTRAVELEPTNPFYNYALGSVQAHTGNWAGALPHFRKYAESRPDDPRGKFAVAVALFRLQEDEESARMLEQVAGHSETAAGSNHYLGLLAMRANDYETAASRFRRAAALAPESPDSNAELAAALMAVEKYPEAEAALKAALAKDAAHFRSNELLLVLYRRTKDERAKQQAARLDTLKAQRAEDARMFLRTIQARPY
jgi:tetratricopeptide (TPR) repeat protein